MTDTPRPKRFGEKISFDKQNFLGNGKYGEEVNDSGVYSQVDGDIYAVGDIHGDSGVLIHILCDLIGAVSHVGIRSPASLIDDRLNWIKGNNSTIVFCGDLIDRLRPDFTPSPDDENSDLEIIRTLDRLDTEARLYGGRIFMILGNHELSYGFNISKPNNERLEYVSQLGRYNNRLVDFTPGSEWAKYVADNTYMALKIGNVVFTHAGVCEVSDFLKMDIPEPDVPLIGFSKMVPDPIARLNALIRKFLRTLPYPHTSNKFKLNPNVFYKDEIEEIARQLDDTYNSDQKKSVVLCRTLGTKVVDCRNIDKVFRDLKMDPANSIMLIAHTPQLPGMGFGSGINSVCDNKLWRIDCGMTRGFDVSLEQVVPFLLKKTTVQAIKGVVRELERFILDLPSKQMAVLKIEKGIDGIYRTDSDKIINHGYHPFTRPEYIDRTNVVYSPKLDRFKQSILEGIDSSKSDLVEAWNNVFVELQVNFKANKYGTVINEDTLRRDNEKLGSERINLLRKYKIIY